jgi:hypothetical protein
VIYGIQRGISGISLELVDGGQMDRIAVSNVTIDGVETPLFVRLGNRGKGFTIENSKEEKARPIGTLRNVSFENVIATRAGKTGCSIVGLPDHPVENVSLSNVTIRSEGGGKREWAANVIEEHANGYPEATMFGKLPSHGLYCRHVKGLMLTDLRLLTDEPDGRPALVMDDVQEANVSGLACTKIAAGMSVVRLMQARNVLIRGCRPEADGVFLRLEGKDTTGIALIGNDFSRVGKAAESAKEVDPHALRSAGNVEPKERGIPHSIQPPPKTRSPS